MSVWVSQRKMPHWKAVRLASSFTMLTLRGEVLCPGRVTMAEVEIHTCIPDSERNSLLGTWPLKTMILVHRHTSCCWMYMAPKIGMLNLIPNMMVFGGGEVIRSWMGLVPNKKWHQRNDLSLPPIYKSGRTKLASTRSWTSQPSEL